MNVSPNPAHDAQHFAADMEVFRSTLDRAKTEKRAELFALLSREGIRWTGRIEKQIVIDELREVGLAASLDEETIQAALEHAVEHPFDPAAVKANGNGRAGGVPT
jgi:hypothetical protein